MTIAISPHSKGNWQPGHFRKLSAVELTASPLEVDPKPENASRRMAEVAVRVTTPPAGEGGEAGPGAESGSRASGLVGTLRGRRHIPGNGGARPGASGAGRRARADAAAGRGSVEVAAAAEDGGWREARASEGGAEVLELWEGAGQA